MNISFEDVEKSFTIEEFLEEYTINDETTITSNFEIISKNSHVGDILKELTLLGIDIESYGGADAYYIKLVAEEDMIQNSKKQRSSGFFEEFEKEKEARALQ